MPGNILIFNIKQVILAMKHKKGVQSVNNRQYLRMVANEINNNIAVDSAVINTLDPVIRNFPCQSFMIVIA